MRSRSPRERSFGQVAGKSHGNLRRPPPTAVNRPGFAHIAFVVDDVEAGLGAVKKAGGGAIGEIVSLVVAGAGTVTLVYAADPEDNIIELQCWSREMRTE